MEMTDTYRREVLKRREQDKRRISMPLLWPRHPVLPMKKHRGQGQFPTCGFITEKQPSVVYEFSIFQVPKIPNLNEELEANLPPEKIHRYESVDAMLEAGWTID